MTAVPQEREEKKTMAVIPVGMTIGCWWVDGGTAGALAAGSSGNGTRKTYLPAPGEGRGASAFTGKTRTLKKRRVRHPLIRMPR